MSQDTNQNSEMGRSKLFWALFLLPFALAFCQSQPPDPVRGQQAHIHYYQDSRTGLCFAGYLSFYAPGNYITNVACTSEVMKLVEPIQE